MMVVLSLLEELFCILDVVFVLFFLLLWALRGGRLGQLDVVFYYLVGEDHALVWTPDPRRLRLYLNWWHAELFEDLLLETGSYVGTRDVGQAEEKTGSDLSGESEHYFGEDGAESILIRERFELSLFITFLILLTAKILQLFLDEPIEAGELILEFTLWEDGY